MTTDPIKIRELLHEKTQRHISTAEEYAKACREYSSVFSEYQRLLAVRIMTYRSKKANLGVEMAILMALADSEWEERECFEKINKEVNRLKYLRKGLERVIDAYESEKISIQSILKYDSLGEKFYTGD
jgi:hypothetical protein